MARFALLFCTLALVAGCAERPFDPSRMVSQLPSESPQYQSAYTVKEIEALKPQLKFPIVLAVSQPTSGRGMDR